MNYCIEPGYLRRFLKHSFLKANIFNVPDNLLALSQSSDIHLFDIFCPRHNMNFNFADKANGPRGRKNKKKSVKEAVSQHSEDDEGDTTKSEATESEVEEEPRKKTSKRTASVAALAAITDTTHKELEEEELIKSLPLVETKAKKAVAIVRPQPQQVIGAKNNNNTQDRDAR